MKSLVVLLLVLLPCLPLLADGMVEGVTADLNVNTDTVKQDELKATAIDVELRPGVILRPFEKLPKKELQPYGIFGLTRERDPDAIDFTINDEFNQLYFGVGAGAFYDVHQNLVNISAGPQLETTLWLKPSGSSAPVYDSYFNLEVSLALLVNLEIQLEKCWWFHTGVEVASVDFNNFTREQGGVKDTDRTFSFNSDFSGNFSPNLGFVYRFEPK